jgi:hypothetical protein
MLAVLCLPSSDLRPPSSGNRPSSVLRPLSSVSSDSVISVEHLGKRYRIRRAHLDVPLGSSVSLRLASVRASLWLAEPTWACLPRANPEDWRDESKPEAYSTTKRWY